LKDFLDEAARVPELPAAHDQHVARIMAEIAEAMQAAHEAGVIHRDLKPQNVLITSEDRPKVTDFGLARVTDESALSESGDFVGTYFYMSPEQVAARRMGIDHRTDVFSLGIVLYELLALRRPFEGDTRFQVAVQILTKDPPDLRTIRSRVPRDLAIIAGKALEKDRNRRYSTMKELAADLRRHLLNEPIQARPPTRLERVAKWTKRNPAKGAAAALATVTFTAIAFLLASNLRANRALAAKSEELEAKSLESEQRRLAAERSAERERVAAEAARKRADEVLRLSALQDLDELLAEANELWPPHPSRVRAYVDWIDEACRLVADLPVHRSKHAEVRPEERLEGTSAEDRRQARWWNDQLSRLIGGLEELDHGLLTEDGTSADHGWSVPKRLAFARALEAGLAPGGAHERSWSEALPEIRAAYPGLALTPQVGLVPIGPDPISGLWEFAHLQTGEAAQRGPDGALVLTRQTGIVLVLLTGGTFWMGAQRADPSRPSYDPDAQLDEALHRVQLSPFFLSKYELTQRHWHSIMGKNPSYWVYLRRLGPSPDPALDRPPGAG
jgi:hypothetical protein